MTQDDRSGDDYLCPFELHMWSLVQAVLFRWNTFVIFKWQSMNCPEQKKGLIQFFVPRDCTHRYEIEKFLNYELEKEKQEPTDLGFADGSGKRPGQDVLVSSVMPFSGIQFHVDRDIIEKMVKGLTMKIINDLKQVKKKSEKKTVKEEGTKPVDEIKTLEATDEPNSFFGESLDR